MLFRFIVPVIVFDTIRLSNKIAAKVITGISISVYVKHIIEPTMEILIHSYTYNRPQAISASPFKSVVQPQSQETASTLYEVGT